MAEPTDLAGDILRAVEVVNDLVPTDGDDLAAARIKKAAENRTKALSLRMAGFTYEQIAEQLKISHAAAENLVNRTLEAGTSRQANMLRELEAQRLDRAQVAIWPQVLNGDHRSIDTFLRISTRRARLFGLDAPTKVDLSVSVRQEMEAALTALERVILEGEVVTDDPPAPGDQPALDAG